MKTQKQKIIQKQNAITLVALVVTIIILLILAGITINALTESGLFGKAKEAKEKYSISEAKEKIELAIMNLRLEEEIKERKLTKDSLSKLNDEEITVESTENFPVEAICNGHKFEIDENYNVKYVGEADGTIIKYTTNPEGYTNKDEIIITINVNSAKGIKTIEVNGEVTEGKGEKEKTINYTVTSNGTYTVNVIDEENQPTKREIVIDKIDKLRPKDFTPTCENITSDGFTIVANTQDEEAKDGSVKSGIGKYLYYIKGTEDVNYKIFESTEERYIATGLEEDTEYSIFVLVHDKAGNINGGVVIKITTPVNEQIRRTPAKNMEEAQMENMLKKLVNSPIEDANGNKITIPAGFKVTTDTTKANEGIVIIDNAGNEFVWIPVPQDGKVYTNAEKTDYKEVILNRYTFDTNGNPTPQNASVIANGSFNYQELQTSTYENTTAKSITNFKSSVSANKGYYIGRYEARKNLSGTITEKGTDNVWTSVSQQNAAIAARDMYDSTKPYTSDLMNSYAWDTATLFLQRCGTNSKYSMQKPISSSKAETGTNNQSTKDVQCNVYDMASNVWEFTTETSSLSSSPGTIRGGGFHNRELFYMSIRERCDVSKGGSVYGFRPILYF